MKLQCLNSDFKHLEISDFLVILFFLVIPGFLGSSKGWTMKKKNVDEEEDSSENDEEEDR